MAEVEAPASTRRISSQGSDSGASEEDYQTFQPELPDGNSLTEIPGNGEVETMTTTTPRAVAQMVMGTLEFKSVLEKGDANLHRNKTGSSLSKHASSGLSKHVSSGLTKHASSGLSKQASSGLSRQSSNGGLLSRVSTGRFLTRQSTMGLVPVEELRTDASASGFPTFHFMDFGIEWHTDISSLLTNSLRREMADLYTIMQSMHERRDSLREGDVKSFFVWFEIFASYIPFVMAVIEETYLPWVERIGELPEDEYLESEGGRMKVGKDIVRTSQRILKHRKEFEAMSVASAYRKIKRVLVKWAELLHGYLKVLDFEAPLLLKAHSSPEECQNMMGWIARLTVDSDNKSCNIVLLVRFLQQRPRTLATWKATFLEAREQGMHPQYWKRLSKSHFEVASYFARILAKANEDTGKRAPVQR